MTSWRVDLRISPYSGVIRGPCPKYLRDTEPQRGEERASIVVEAGNFDDAQRLAEAARLGVMLDERVWQARIVGLVEVRP